MFLKRHLYPVPSSCSSFCIEDDEFTSYRKSGSVDFPYGGRPCLELSISHLRLAFSAAASVLLCFSTSAAAALAAAVGSSSSRNSSSQIMLASIMYALTPVDICWLLQPSR